MHLPKWKLGRQMSGYDKLSLISSNRLKFDLWLLRFREGAFIDPHVDTVTNHRHYRLNIYIKSAKVGGVFEADNVIFKNRFMSFFRPDITKHSVTKIERGVRYVLSFGFALKGK